METTANANAIATDNDNAIERVVGISIQYMSRRFGVVNYAEFDDDESAEVALGMFRVRGFSAYRVNSHVRFAK